MLTPEEKKIAQKFADKIWKQALKKQPATVAPRNILFGNGCYLRDANGNKCFIGACIPNSRYRISLEEISQSFHYPQMLDALGLTEISEEMHQFLSSAQEIHDNDTPEAIENWTASLAILFDEYGLTHPDIA